ncbi:UDP-N-acetylmuramoyl-tripeptide--D-alanyl-D-alanine ligase [Thermodesulfobacteriota bacterium]
MMNSEAIDNHKVVPAPGKTGDAISRDPVWNVLQVLEATGGSLLGNHGDTEFRGVSTDTRNLAPGDLFVALDGEIYDGHDYVGKALEKKAAGLVVSKKVTAPLGLPVVMVEDTLQALGDLARHRRTQIPGLQVLAITGSSGKTTVKEMTAAIASQHHQVVKTQGNFNNLIGLPLSLLPVDCGHELAILEMGMNSPGEISRLTEIADPDIGCIVNIQESHLAGLGSIEDVARAKGELFSGIRQQGKLAVNLDDSRVKALADQSSRHHITFGRHRNAEIRATQITCIGESGMKFTLQIGNATERVNISTPGVHNVLNSLAAAALAHGVGIDIGDICSGLGSFRAPAKRFQIQQHISGVKLINDTYNANPSSVIAALETLRDLGGNSRRVVVLGDMLELGEQSRAIHEGIGERICRLGNEYFLTYGDMAARAAEAAVAAGMNTAGVRSFDDKQKVQEWIEGLLVTGKLSRGDWILFKGSRGMQMETIIEALLGGGDGGSG